MWKIISFVIVLSLLNTEALPQDTKENAEFKLAINLYNEGFCDLAISQLKKFIETYPNSPQAPEAQFYLGMSYFKLRKFEEAQTIFQNFALSKPSHPKAIEALWKSAECLVELKKYKEAGSAFERIKLFYPQSQFATKALIESAKYFELANDIQSTKKVLLALIQEYPNNEHFYTARFKLAEILTKEKNFERALTEYRKISKEVEDKNLRFKALLNIANINSIIGKTEDSEKLLREITSQSGIAKDIIATAYLELGKLQSEFGEYEEAINSTLKAQSFIDPNDTSESTKILKQKIFIQLANYYFNIADYQNAIKFYNELLKLAPDSETNREVWFDIATSFDKILNYQKANEFYLKIINSDTTTYRMKSLLNLAKNYIRLGEFKTATQFYQKYLELYPADKHTPDILFQLALTYEENLNDYKKAIFYYTDLLNRFPKSKYVDEAFYHIAQCYVKLGEINDAITTFETLLKNYPSSELYDEVLDTIEKLKRFNIANHIDHTKSIVEIISDLLLEKPRGKIILKLADLYNFNLKDYANALKYYDMALSEGEFEQKMIAQINYRKLNCAYNLFLEGKLSSDSAKSIVQKFIDLETDPEKIDTAIYYLYKIQTLGLNQEGRKKIAEDFRHRYSNSKFYPIFITEIINYYMASENWKEVIKLATENFNKFDDRRQIAEILYKRAYAYYKIGENKKSLSDIDLILTKYSPSPYDAKTLDLKAQILKENKNYVEAAELLRELENKYFYTALAEDTKMKIADLYFELGDYLKAIDEYNSYLLTSTRENPEVLFKIASAYKNLGDLQNAKRHYKLYLSTPKPAPGITLQALLPLAGDAYYALGNIYKAEMMSEKAVYYFDRAGKFNSALRKKAMLESAQLSFENEKYDEALKRYKDALQSAQNDSERVFIQSKIITCLLRMNDLDEANKNINLFKQTFSKLNIKDYLAEFQIELGGYHFRNNNIANAIKIFEDIKKNYPETRFSYLAQYWLAKIDEQAGRFETAVKSLLELNKKPLDKDLRLRVNLSLGNIYFKLEKYDSATIYLRFVAETSQDLKILQFALNNLLACYEELGYYELGIEIARRYIEKFPNAEDIIDKKIKIGVMYEMLGNYDLALSYFQKLLEEADKDLETELHYYIGETLYHKGEYEAAILEFLKVPYLVTRKTKIDWTANAFYMAGQSYEKMKKYDQAINMYQQIIDRPGIDPIFKAGAQKEIERVKSILKQ